MERRKRVTVVLLHPRVMVVPQGGPRTQLQQGGRIADVLLQRSWTDLRVRQTICEAFINHLDPDDSEGDIVYFSANAGAGISIAPDPSTLSGQSTDVGWTGLKVIQLAGKENLYIKSKKEVQEVKY